MLLLLLLGPLLRLRLILLLGRGRALNGAQHGRGAGCRLIVAGCGVGLLGLLPPLRLGWDDR